ncbi:MAG: hypothetical protein H0T92_14705 [Pyrinomonadaceae bacterium]|nr:hypothetical protein [Pyrinomonadaceae bacterium]
MRQLLILTVLTIATSSSALSQTTDKDAGEFPTGTYASEPFFITFAGGGKVRVWNNEGTIAEGSYTVTKDRLVMTDKQGRGACLKEGQETGTYHWQFDVDGKVLKFSKVADNCERRASYMEKHRWVNRKVVISRQKEPKVIRSPKNQQRGIIVAVNSANYLHRIFNKETAKSP